MDLRLNPCSARGFVARYFVIVDRLALSVGIVRRVLGDSTQPSGKGLLESPGHCRAC